MHLSEEPIINPKKLAARVDTLATEIARDFADGELTIVIVLKGAVVFAVDLMRRLPLSCTLEFVRATSYRGTRSTGSVELTVLTDEPFTGKHVLIVEDILDTGRTTSALIERLKADRPARLALCTLLDKPARRTQPITADYVGFTIDDIFVVGYGLDYEGRYRHLPAVYGLEEGAE